MVRGTLEVIEFEPRQVGYDVVPLHYAQEREDLWSSFRREHRKLTQGAVAVTVLAFHALLVVVPAIWGTGLPPVRPSERRAGTDTALQWVMLSDSSPDRTSPSSSLASPALSAIHIAPTPLPSPAALRDGSEARQSPAADDSSFAALTGRYVGQIHARIDRAWLRPRTAIGAAFFRCRVQVDQDEEGKVDAVTLLECNGDARWQGSLVRAIEEASPLPAPPEQAVFFHHVVLEFRAIAYFLGAPEGLYEPTTGSADARSEEGGRTVGHVFQALRDAAHSPRSHRALELRIEGSKVEVEPDH